jgi:hypothetical protein
MAEKIAKARKQGKLDVSTTVILREYKGGMSPRVAGIGYKEITYVLERNDLEKALEIANYWSQNPVVAELPPVPSPVGGASAPSGGNDEGFGPDGKIVTCGSVPSTGCPDVGEEVLVTMKE